VHQCLKESNLDPDSGELTGRDLTLQNYMTFEREHLFYAVRLLAALVAATLVPLLIDRRFRR
jgi:hypothetical protein